MSLSLVTKVRYINRQVDIPLRGRKGEAERIGEDIQLFGVQATD